jgi:diaminohydroxyphosphoribosylaminopyrimidine deaminase/5-amino-6-(5-phosphoribosylamino)uracil reductase
MSMEHHELGDSHWMQRAIRLARKGIGTTHPNPRVGAVVVKNGEVIGEGWHERPGGPHAEVHALQDAGDAARGATIYVTLEPCNAQGRTPPCSEAIIKAGIARVVYASGDPNPKMAGGGSWLAGQGLDVTDGILRDEADALNRPFFHFLSTGRPWVIAKAAMSLDGKLATWRNHSQWISGPESRLHAHGIRAASDAILVGAGTFVHDNPSLTVRDVPRNGEPPLRVVVALEAPEPFEGCKLLDRSAPSRLYVTNETDHADAWRAVGMEVVCIDDLEALLAHLAAEGRLQLMVEGGGGLHASLLEAHLADELVLYQAPILIGGTEAVSLWHGTGVAAVDEAVRLEAIERKRLGEDQLIRGQLVYPD